MKPIKPIVRRYTVRPRPNTRGGWYVWAVIEAAGKEMWADHCYALYASKREARDVVKSLNAMLEQAGTYRPLMKGTI